MPDKPSLNVSKQVARGVAILQQGGIVAFPTDTVYGLGACASNRSAVERIYAVKQRPRHQALPLLLASVLQIREVGSGLSPVALCLVRSFMPGALTLVLRKAGAVPDLVTAGEATVAVRIPAHPVPLSLIEGLGEPIVGTSANLSGSPSALTAADVYAQLGDKVDLIIDGVCQGGMESTIVDVTGDKPVVLREGAISRAELARVCEID